jgi:OFA family oxalate/formate antiporter-like MFS transporter
MPHTQRTVPRWIIAAAGTILQLCLGTVYAWSFFQSILIRVYHWSNTASAWAFSLEILALGISAAWAGFNLPRFGARRLALTGAVLFSLSFLLAGLALRAHSVPLFYLGFSLVGGIGIGFGYVTPVATVAKWFPDRKGLVTGVVVMGFGFGAFVMSKLLAPLLLAVFKGDLVMVFEALAVVSAVVAIPSALVLHEPPPGYAPGASSVAINAVAVAAQSPIAEPIGVYLLSHEFRFMWIAFFFNIGAGISVISFQSSLLEEVWGAYDPTLEPVTLAGYGATLIAISSLFNGCGRLLWGMVADRIGRAECFRLLLASQMIVFGLLLTVHNPWLFGALVCYVLLCFGGGFGVMPSFVLEVFGSQRMSMIYGSMLTAWAAAGIVGPVIMAAWRDHFPDRAVIDGFLTGVLFLGSGFICSFLLSNDRCRPGTPPLDDLGLPSAVA